MEKAILSRINLQRQDTHIAQEYFDTISDLIDTQEVQALKKCSQHMATSRFQHSLNVSYYSFLICRKFGIDAYSAHVPVYYMIYITMIGKQMMSVLLKEIMR